MDDGGDVDTEVVWASPDDNEVHDLYMKFDADDAVIFANAPGKRLAIEIEYLDEGTDSFSIQYDAQSGMFKDTGDIIKTDSGGFAPSTRGSP